MIRFCFAGVQAHNNYCMKKHDENVCYESVAISLGIHWYRLGAKLIGAV